MDTQDGFKTIKLSIAAPVATLTLARPDALNALDPAMARELHDALSRVEATPSLKALIIRGEGRAFCAGADLRYVESVMKEPRKLKPFIELLNGLFFRLEALPLPVIAVVHGFCLAGGLELALACDLILAADDAQMGDQHANFGLMPGGGATQRLPRKVGYQRAMDLMLTGRRLSGAEAAGWGLALRADPADKLDSELQALLDQLRPKSAESLRRIKTAVHHGLDLPLKDGVVQEIESFVDYLSSHPDPAEGIQAFKERRQPRF
ncbi:MAG: enoyl-CoA hydratase/isomerase family protein [SAR202 cluster bacterium]|nr:enoyl-CoA hydratase/isomerase family protein [SAR202 cluster bacterium]